jgi:glyoxylase-like metal-dependent hydrolase (beta-lactamase superfamily II)
MTQQSAADSNHPIKQLTYPYGETLAEQGKTLKVAPGIYWVRMPLPFALDHINLWLLRDQIDGRDGWTIIDCGIANDQTKECWESIFAKHLDGLPILRILVTHMHPDHIGLAHFLCERWHAPLWISMSDFLMAQWLSSKEGGSALGGTPGSGGAADLYSRHGLREMEDLERIRSRADYYSRLVPEVPKRYRRMMEQENIQIGAYHWKVSMGYGHAPEHATLYCAELNLFISGDMVLPRISTNVSVYDADPDANPLLLYLRSLDQWRSLPTDVLVLPSHGKPFRGLQLRIEQLHEHHRERLGDTLKACQEPRNAFEIIPVLFKRTLDHHQLSFAMGEAIAHLNYLWHQKKLQRSFGEDGIWRFCVT